MMLVTVFGNKLNHKCFFFVLGWGKLVINTLKFYYVANTYAYRTSHSYSYDFYWNSSQTLWHRILVSL